MELIKMTDKQKYLWIQYGIYCNDKTENELSDNLYDFQQWKDRVYAFENIDTYENYVSQQSKKYRTENP